MKKDKMRNYKILNLKLLSDLNIHIKGPIKLQKNKKRKSSKNSQKIANKGEKKEEIIASKTKIKSAAKAITLQNLSMSRLQSINRRL
jgi:hypothetical protein